MVYGPFPNNDLLGNFTFNVNQNPPNVNANNQNQFNAPKPQPQEQKKTGLSSLLDSKLVNLDSLGPKRTNNYNSNDFNNYW